MAMRPLYLVIVPLLHGSLPERSAHQDNVYSVQFRRRSQSISLCSLQVHIK